LKLAALAVLIFAAATGWAQEPRSRDNFQPTDKTRDQFQRATDLLGLLEIAPGDWVADVGAGGGYYSMRMDALVGENGKVFAEDITPSAVQVLNQRNQLFDLKHVEVVKGDAEDPKLPTGQLAAILIVDSYHHFTNHTAMLEKLRLALKPGGRLAIADYSIASSRGEPRAEQLKKHLIEPAIVRSELEQAGFRIKSVEDPFVKWKPGAGNTRQSEADFWVIVAVRP
jgi:predicted methyltransferase